MQIFYFVLVIIMTIVPAQGVHATLDLSRDFVQEETNKSLVIGYYERLHKYQDTKKAFELLSPYYKDNTEGKARNRSAYVNFCNRYLFSNPNYHSEILHAATEGDWVYLYTRTFTTSASRAKISVNMYKVKNGFITEHKSFTNP